MPLKRVYRRYALVKVASTTVAAEVRASLEKKWLIAQNCERIPPLVWSVAFWRHEALLLICETFAAWRDEIG
jgi:hypothetical protein